MKNGFKLILAFCLIPMGLSAAEKPPVILFSNDTTNITTCESPFRGAGEPFREQMLKASVVETASLGVDVHMLQPGLGWVPWWQSQVYPMQEHVEWLRSIKPASLNSYDKYIINGGDIVKVALKTARETGQLFFVSYRLNDYHHILHSLSKLDFPNEREKALANCKFYYEHPEYRIGPGMHGSSKESFNQYLQDWTHKEVRDYKFSLISEICRNYDIDGLELDFMRHACYFNSQDTTARQRIEIMTVFVKRVKELLNKTSRDGRQRFLCVRVPFRLKDCEAIGIDFPSIAKAGVDMLNLSCHYVTEQQSDLHEIHKQVPNTPVYFEMTNVSNLFKNPNRKKQTFFVATTDQQFCTTAHLAYARGAFGLSLFNFVYYRDFSEKTHGADGSRIDVSEPPFYIIRKIRDKKWLARQPQHYYLTRFDADYKRVTKLPVKVGELQTFKLDMAPPVDGWEAGGRLRVQFLTPYNGSKWKLRFNNTELEPTGDISEPYPSPYKDGLGDSQTLLAWKLPAEIIKNGINKIELAAIEGTPPRLISIDIAVK